MRNRYEATPPTIADHGECSYDMVDSAGRKLISVGASAVFPTATAPADNKGRPATVTIVESLLKVARSVGGTLDEVKGGIRTKVATVVGWVNTLPGITRRVTPEAVADGETTTMSCNARGDLLVAGAAFARIAHRASAALPNAGAFTDATDTPFATLAEGTRSVTFVCTYTRGAAGGYALYQVWYGDGTSTWSAPTRYEPVLVTTGAGAVTAAITVAVPPGVTTVRLSAREMGVVATPGTLVIGMVGGASDSTEGERTRSVLIDLSGSTPASATTAAGVDSISLGFDDLAGLENFRLYYSLAGTDGTPAGGTIDMYLQTTTDGILWLDWYHVPATIASGAAAIFKIETFALSTANTAIGTGVTPALAADAYAGGHPGRGVRVVWVTGAGTNHAVAQTVQLHCTRRAR